MKFEPTKSYPPVGCCIYCGDDKSKLTDEHIIPYALGGNLVLPKASCLKCADIISKFERTVLRNMFGRTRMRLNLPTRRPKKRPAKITVEIGNQTQKLRSIDLAPHQIPLAFVGFTCGPPGILLGNPPSDRFKGNLWVKINEDDFRKHAGDGEGFSVGQVNPTVLATVLAKIAHGFVVGEYGLNSFRPLLTDIILGKCSTPFHFIGTLDDNTEADFKGFHKLEVSSGNFGGIDYFVATIRLFCSYGTPEYIAVVGQKTN